ncbi:tRNA uridine-5-carboxymethylaminomethyl(34) synthesis GTPase MnmE [Alphaproteobacteria bacterium]|nr:tRNA uridine-5-carboxymethylaminomethyl(34) synthesis GTPase MnmE [Alphaproteobacteria bacterium]
MKHNDYDTIFASANQLKSAIKIIRISGNKAKNLPEIFGFQKPEPRIFSLRKLLHKNKVIDNAPVVWLPKNNSFTGEDTFEIYIHGSTIIEKLIYKVLSSCKGFRLAEPGEFTKRATLNGNIDLVQAESINEIINAQTEKQLNIAQSQLDGSLSKVINGWRDEIIHIASLIEALIDFSDEDIPEEICTLFLKKLNEIQKQIKNALNSAKLSSSIKEGFIVSIIGKPNVGKSSLINALTKLDTSIVSDIPGTTRDVIQQKVDLKGLPVTFYDTAGIRKTKNIIEKKGIELAINIMKKSNLILNLSENGEFNYESLEKFFLNNNRIKVFNVKTKIDIKKSNNKDADVEISSKTNFGINTLLEKIFSYLSVLEPRETSLITSERQILNSKKALNALTRIKKLSVIEETELIAEELRLASKHISNITSLINNENVLDKIFSSFCIGK